MIFKDQFRGPVVFSFQGTRERINTHKTFTTTCDVHPNKGQSLCELRTKSFKVSCRSSLFFKKMFFKIGVLKNFAIFTGKHLCRSLFLVKLQAWASNFVKRGTNTGVFLWILRKSQEQLFLQNISGGCFWSLFYMLIVGLINPFMHNVEKWPNAH